MHRFTTIAAATGLHLASAAVALAQDGPVNVATTIGMIGDVAQQVGGDCAQVTAIMGPGIDPHLYQPTPSDVRLFRDAEAILYSGYALEGRLGAVLERFGEQKPTVAVAPASIDPTELITVEGADSIDPHIWMDAGLWSGIASTIAATLGEVRPSCADSFEASAERYAAELGALDAWVAEAITTIPEDRRILVTAHDAFTYYGRAYGIDVAGIQGISTEAEPSVADIRATAEMVAASGVPAMFVESTINPRTVQAVIDAVRQQGHEIEIGGQLYSDAMGATGTAGGTYIGMIYENTARIVEALGGDLPPLPDALEGWAATWDLAGTASE